MAKIKSVKSNTEVYAEIIADIASRAAAEIEGAELLGKNPDKSRIIKDNDVHAYVKSDNTVDIDIYLNILYGYNIPDTVCKVQIAIKKQSKRKPAIPWEKSTFRLSVLSSTRLTTPP